MMSIVAIDFVEVVRTATVHTDSVDAASEHIIDEHSGNGTLSVGRVIGHPFCLAGWVCGFFAPCDPEDVIKVIKGSEFGVTGFLSFKSAKLLTIISSIHFG